MQKITLTQIKKSIMKHTGEHGTTAYTPKGFDEKNFYDQHKIEVTDDVNGNGDDVFKGTNVKVINRKAERHGYGPEEAKKAYDLKFGKQAPQATQANEEVHIYKGEWANHAVKTSTGTHKVYGPVDKDEMEKHLHSQPGGAKYYGKVQSMKKDTSPIEPTHDPKSNRSYNEEVEQQNVAEGSNKLKGTPVVSLSDFSDKDTKKDKYGRTVPKKLNKDDPRVKYHKDERRSEEVVKEDEQIEERSSKLDEAAKWRSTSVAKKITNPEDESGSSYDYHHDNPRSTGILRATSDTPKKYGSLYSRQQADPIKSGSRKGMITKKHAQRLKDKIRSGMHNEETLTSGETAERERIVKGMKKTLKGFKARYGKDAKSVMYATATKLAKEEVEDVDTSLLEYWLTLNTEEREMVSEMVEKFLDDELLEFITSGEVNNG